MSELVAQSFPELAYLVMRATPNKSSFRLSEIVELSLALGIEIRIESQYKAYSPEWIEVLNGGLKRDSGDEHKNNEGHVCLFNSEGHVCTEPWGLCELPIQGETYAEFRRRVRGTNTLKKALSLNPLAFLLLPKSFWTKSHLKS